MQTGKGTNYAVTVSCGGNDGGTLSFNAQSGADDAFVLALATAIKNVPFPGGEEPVNVFVTKVENSTTASNVDWTDTPPAFT